MAEANKQNTSEAARRRLQGIGMSEPATVEFIEKGIAAARTGNRLLARLHFERAAQAEVVDPLVWLWLAWVSDSPFQAATHLKKLQTGPFATLAAAGLQWVKALAEGNDRPTRPASADAEAAAGQTGSTESAAHDSNGPVYGLGCPGCRARLRIWGKIIGPMHHCPACGTVFVAEQDPNDPARLIRRRLSAKSPATDASDAGTTPDAGQPVVLVLDDRAARRQLMVNVLRRANFRVLSAVTGIEALELATEHKPQLILLDGNLQGQDAFAVCKELRSRPETSTTPIVMLSNKSGFFDQIQARLAGCTVYITKPCEADVLLTHVQNLTQPASDAVCVHDPISNSTTAAPAVPDQPVAYAVSGLLELKDSTAYRGLEAASKIPQITHFTDKDPAELQASIFG